MSRFYIFVLPFYLFALVLPFISLRMFCFLQFFAQSESVCQKNVRLGNNNDLYDDSLRYCGAIHHTHHGNYLACKVSSIQPLDISIVISEDNDFE